MTIFEFYGRYRWWRCLCASFSEVDFEGTVITILTILIIVILVIVILVIVILIIVILVGDKVR